MCTILLRLSYTLPFPFVSNQGYAKVSAPVTAHLTLLATIPKITRLLLSRHAPGTTPLYSRKRKVQHNADYGGKGDACKLELDAAG